jgi:acyl-CoA synthetase (AMP-forming)/AMP-acid ligase II
MSSLARDSHAPPFASVAQLLAAHAERDPDAPAILAPGRVPLTYGDLWRQVDDVVGTLRTLGVECHDRVALVLPQSAEMAVAFVALAAGAACVPLNPAYGLDECMAYLADLKASTLVIHSRLDAPARAAARARGLRIIDLSPLPQAAAGLFTLGGEPDRRAASHRFARPGDVALVLQTSGTTSRPKTILLTHNTICTWVHDIGIALELHRRDRCLNVMPLFHAHGLLVTTLASLMAGASVVHPEGFDAARTLAEMEQFHPTWYSASPTIHQALLAHADQHARDLACHPLRLIRSSSGSLPPRVLADLERVFHAPVIEAYGLSEAHIQITCNPLPPGRRKKGSVGPPAGLEIAVMDPAGNILPAGQSGEIVVPNTYLSLDDGNHSTAQGTAVTPEWYRTGDLGYVDTQGYLFVTGRLKEVINRGGEKIAPREVDEVLAEHPAVEQAVTFAVPHARLGEDIAAAVVLRPDTRATVRELRRFVATRLVAFKVPSQLYLVQEIPKGPAGKVQRLRLAEQLGLTAPGQTEPHRRAGFVAPRTDQEELLAGLWAQVLDLERVGIHDNFFELGGESILAAQLLSRVGETVRVEVDFSSFFEMPTVAGLASSIEAARQGNQGVPTPPILPIPHQGRSPVSVAQEAIWILDQALSGTSLFNTRHAIRLTGVLDFAALEQSVNEVIARHETLRARFATVDGHLMQVIAPPRHLPLEVEDLGDLPETERAVRARQRAREVGLEPFDLGQAPPLRVRLLRLSEHDHILLVTLHTIMSDGWSVRVFAQELSVLYEAFAAAKPSPLPPLPVQYADFVHWQQQWRRHSAREARLAYWRQQLRAPLPVLAFPTDHPRTETLSFRTAHESLTLSRSLSEALKRSSRREGGTLFMTLLTAFKALLHAYTGQEDLCVSTLVANRQRPEVEGLIGLFANTVLLRTNLGGNPTLRELWRRVRDTTLAAYAHQDLPFEDLVRAMEGERSLQRSSLCQVMFILHQNMPQTLQLPDLRLSLLESEQGLAEREFTATTFDVVLELRESPRGLIVDCTYKTTLFEADTIIGMLRDFRDVLERLVARPEQTLRAESGAA